MVKNKTLEIIILLNAYAFLVHILVEFEISVLSTNIWQLFTITILTIVVGTIGRII